MAKQETLRVAQYLVSKNGETKYLKFDYGPNADQATKDAVEAIKKAIGGDILYVNVFDEEFKEKYNVPDFVKGSVSMPVTEAAAAPAPEEKKAAPTKKKPATTGGDW